MPNGVSCSVSNCSYWAQGNKCGASQIAIEIDAHANTAHGDGEEFADELTGEGRVHQDTADSSAATCCLTFKPKRD